jgi:hypothetical protein
MKRLLTGSGAIYIGLFLCTCAVVAADDMNLRKAPENGRLANEGFIRCRNIVTGLLKHADPKTGLIPRNLSRDKDTWNAKDGAAEI